MTLWTRLLATLALVLGYLPSAALGEEYNPFRIPKVEFFKSVHTIALWPFNLPPDTPDIEFVQTKLEQMLMAALQRQGFSVLSSEQLRRRWEEMSTRLGGVFDPISGASDEEEIKLLRGLLTQEFALKNGIDALLSPAVTEGTIRIWAKSIASKDSDGRGAYTAWMAAHEQTTWRGEPIRSLWANRPHQAVGPRLGFRIIDPTDIHLYDIMVPIRWSRVYVNGNYEDRPETELLDHHKRIEEVIEAAVEQLAQSAEADGEND